jgi:glycosyltransferase involved in cell wall biosynthesis
MLLFIAEYPNKENERDGMLQRVSFIDNIASDAKRIYVCLSYTKHFKMHKENYNEVEIYYINSVIHLLFLLNIARKSDLIYVHSILNSVRIPFVYIFFGNKIITDMHGAVPEEIVYFGNPVKAKIFAHIERFAVKHSRKLIVVTKNMENHFREKYELSDKNISIVPGLNIYRTENVKETDAKIHIIYAGGVQKWQNVDLMLDFIDSVREKSYDFTLLVSDTSTVGDGLIKRNLENRVILKSVSHDMVLEEYLKSHVGIIFRDDILLNHVALPTKLIEYMSAGLVPLISQPKIGDFVSYDYAYLTINDMINKKIDHEYIHELRLRNDQVLEQIKHDSDVGRGRLRRNFEKLNFEE